MKQRCLMLGAGGMAGVWIRHIWPLYHDRVAIVALVDVNQQALDESGDFLGLPAGARFQSMPEAFACSDADFCCIVTPPVFHHQAIELACARGMDILCEKPLADSWEACKAIYRQVQEAGVRLMVAQNYRYNATILTLKKAIAELGQLNYIVAHWSEDYRVRDSSGAFRHRMKYPILVEYAIHHLDQIRNLTGSNCQFVSGFAWNPGQERSFKGSDSYDGAPCGLWNLQMQNGSYAHYEGSGMESGETHSWHREFYRAECEHGVATLSSDGLVSIFTRENGALSTRSVPIEKPQREGHAVLPQQFLDWREGGPLPPTHLGDNMQTVALMFGALQAAETRRVVDVQELMREASA
jgi:predicted dehydrogenase